MKNDDILPLKKNSQKKLAVIGPFANRCWMGIYSGYPERKITPLDGIKNYTNAEVSYAEGCSVTADALDVKKIEEAVKMAKESDYVVLVVGNDESTSTENTDRNSLKLPGNQHKLIKEVQKVNKNVILVLIPSGPTAITWEQENIPGIICAWPNGQEQGNALANVLFGKVNPGGKLTSTWYKSDNDLPNMHDYSIQTGRTYMYFKGDPLYPFGYGLSYTNFEINSIKTDKETVNTSEDIIVSTSVSNKGKMDGDEIVQVYIKDLKSSQISPIKALKGFKRIHIPVGETKKVAIKIPYEAFAHYDTISNQFRVEAGKFEIMIGKSSNNIIKRKTIDVKGGVIPSIKVGQKSGYFNEKDQNRTKNWDYLYKNSANLKVSTKEKDNNAPWAAYEITFIDPGFYVNSWNAELNFESASKNAVIETSMEGAKISSYQVPESLKLKIKIPIPPEYGKPVKLKIKTLEGEVIHKSITIIPPGDKKPFVINEIITKSE